LQQKPSSQSGNGKQQEKRSLMIFVGAVIILVAIGVIVHLNSDPTHDNVTKFFEQRKTPEEFKAYKDREEDAKAKAERNIFLQD